MSGWTGGAFWLFAVAGILATPKAVEIIKRARHNKVRRQLRADLLREAELRRVTEQRDNYMRLYHEGVAVNAVLLGHVDTGKPIEGTPVFDRACLAWLDKSTEWDDA